MSPERRICVICAICGFGWARGYAVQSVSPQALETVRRYLRGQPRHHPAEAIPGWIGDVAEFDRWS